MVCSFRLRHKEVEYVKILLGEAWCKFRIGLRDMEFMKTSVEGVGNGRNVDVE